MAVQRSSFASRIATSAAVALVAAGCVKDRPEEPKRAVVTSWSFPPPTPASGIRVWPKEPSTPSRKKHGVATEEGTSLTVKVDGKDPYVMWDVEEEVPATSVRVSVQSPSAGSLELFWGSERCPVYSQDCSQVAPLSAGANTIVFQLDPRQKTRGIRIDLPEGPGSVYAFDAVDLSTTPEVDAPWIGRAGEVTVENATNGLTVSAAGNDPWIIAGTPGLAAERVTALELTMPESPPETGPPRLFWNGACGEGFSEPCSKPIPRSEAKGITHRVELGPADKWTGSVRAIRLDPGSVSGRYVIRRIALVRGLGPGGS